MENKRVDHLARALREEERDKLDSWVVEIQEQDREFIRQARFVITCFLQVGPVVVRTWAFAIRRIISLHRGLDLFSNATFVFILVVCTNICFF